MSIMMSDKMPQELKGVLSVADYERDRNHQALIDFVSLVNIIKLAHTGDNILESRLDGSAIPAHIAVFYNDVDSYTPTGERTNGEEIRRKAFLARISGLEIVEHGKIPLKTESVGPFTATEPSAIAAFGGHVLVETTLYMRDDTTVAGQAYDVYPDTILQQTDWHKLTQEANELTSQAD